MTLEQIGLLVAFAGVVISFSVFISNSRKDAGKQEAMFAQINTKLDFQANDLKEIKAADRAREREIQETREIANTALERAQAAHKRLDRAGVDSVERGA